MFAGRPAELLRQLEGPAIRDRDLLARFVSERDQSAFAELVRRHGPVVLGVCRRVIGHQQDAEDAFQAVFLILARKAAGIGKPDLLGNWLYGVAERVARRTLRSAIRRRARETAVSVVPESIAQQVTPIVEVNPIIDEELAALPSWYREAIILCDVRGISREEAAALLGVPEGTISSRLANGRKKLASRLTKRGLTLSAATIATTFSAAQAVCVSAELQAKTCNIVADWLGGAAIPRPLAKLTEGGFSVRKTTMLCLLTSAVSVIGIVYAAQPQTPQFETKKTPVAATNQEKVEKPAPGDKPGDIAAAFTNTPRLLDVIDVNINFEATDFKVCWNAQGTHLAVASSWNDVPPSPPVMMLISLDLYKKQSLENPRVHSQLVGFSPDGKYVLTELREYQFLSGLHIMDFWSDRVNGPSGARTSTRSIKLDTTETAGYAFSTDEKTFRTVAIERDERAGWIKKVHVWEVDAGTGKRIKSLLTANGNGYALSTNGKRLAVMVENKVVVYDVERAKELSSYLIPGDIEKPVVPEDFRQRLHEGMIQAQRPGSMAFSNDGRRLVVCRGIGPTSPLVNLQRNTPPMLDLQGSGLLLSNGLGQTLVLNPENGKPLPALENGEHILPTQFLDQYALSGDGRLLVISGDRQDIDKQKFIIAKDPQREFRVLKTPISFNAVWDTETGKILKNWNYRRLHVAFNPVRPILAALEPNGRQTRIGFWDFSAEVAEKNKG